MDTEKEIQSKKSPRPLIYDWSPESVAAWVSEQGWPSYVGKQLQEWLGRGVTNVDEMTNIAKQRRQILAAAFNFNPFDEIKVLRSSEDNTVRMTLRLYDNNTIEAVGMVYQNRLSVCISTQAGCRMGCLFCASTQAGFARNLTHGEMLQQVYAVGRQYEQPVTHVVLMGIGEPFANYNEVIRLLKTLNDPRYLNLSQRRLTVSTCGLVPMMIKFAREGLAVNLAVSLHAADDELRSRLMPVAAKYGLPELMRACRDYVKTTGRRITFEYALFAGVNDRLRDVKALADLLDGLLCHVNLIPGNSVPGSDLRGSSMAKAREFHGYLQTKGIACTIRRSLGRDIAAACGQLRREVEDE